MVVDFPRAKVREYAGEECVYWYTIPADLVSTNIRDHEIDWSNSIFLSMQFSVGRSGKFNEFLTTFLKCLSVDRIEYVENWYQEQTDQTEDAEIGDWVVQRRCPHLRADLTKTGKVDEDGILTCSMHDWKARIPPARDPAGGARGDTGIDRLSTGVSRRSPEGLAGVIVVDAGVLIAHLSTDDVHQEAARHLTSADPDRARDPRVQSRGRRPRPAGHPDPRRDAGTPARRADQRDRAGLRPRRIPRRDALPR
ncbi:unnamed protein product [Penicillium discolor]